MSYFARISVLGHVQHHNLFLHDYVKLKERIAVLERDIFELRQALSQKPLEGE